MKEESKKYWLVPKEIKELVDILYAENIELEGRPNILCIFRAKGLTSKGKFVYASIKKIGEKENVIHSYFEGHENVDFVIEIAADIWSSLDQNQQEALILHELCHIGQSVKDKEVKWTLVSHQIEEFALVLKKYGLYNVDCQEFLNETKGTEHVQPRLRIKTKETILKIVGENNN